MKNFIVLKLSIVIIAIFLLLIPLSLGNVLPINEKTTHKITAKQYEKTRFVFANSHASKPLYLGISGGHLNIEGEEGKFQMVEILPGETRVIEATFTEQGIRYIINYGEHSSVFAIVQVIPNNELYSQILARSNILV